MAERPEHLVGTDVAIYEDGDELWGLNDRGEFRIDPPYGNSEPQNGLCNATLRQTQARYGETRHCGKTPYWPASTSDEEPSDFCKTHRDREQLMERAIELVQHGYFGRNYAIFEQSLDATEFAFAVDMFSGLLESSKYDYEVETEIIALDSSEDEYVDADEIAVEVPFPQAARFQTQANELWFVSLDEIVEQRMQNIRLMEGVSTSHVVATADDEGTITDVIEEGAEHHLNLPISRLTKDKKERLKIGGVEVGGDEEEGTITFTTGDYVIDMGDEVPDDVPEMEEPLTTQLEAEDE